MNLDFDVAEGKTFRDLCGEIIKRSASKKYQLDTLFSDVRGHIKNANDAVVFLPRLKELLEVGIKNDEQIIKLTGVLQKLQSTQLETGGDNGILTDEEKEQLLLNSVKEQFIDIKKNVETSDVPIILPNIIP